MLRINPNSTNLGSLPPGSAVMVLGKVFKYHGLAATNQAEIEDANGNRTIFDSSTSCNYIGSIHEYEAISNRT